MGGGAPEQPTPAPAPSMQETSAQAIQAQLEAQPQILAAQKEFGPQFSQLNLEQLQKYGPEFAQAALNLQKEFGPQFAQVERDLSPELAGAQTTLASYLGGTDQAEYDALAPGLLQQVRAGQTARGIGAISPLGSIDESVQLQQLKQSLKDRRLNVALSTAGRVPIGGMQNIQGQSGTGQVIQGPSSSDLFGYQQGLNNFNASIFNTQGSMYGQQLASQGDPLGSILGGVAGGLTGGLSTGLGYGLTGAKPAICWVASEVFNEPIDGFRVSRVRRYILNDAPVWFRNWYIINGEKFAIWLKNKPLIKNLIKPLFVWMAKKGAV
jgi:hypothetical protein